MATHIFNQLECLKISVKCTLKFIYRTGPRSFLSYCTILRFSRNPLFDLTNLKVISCDSFIPFADQPLLPGQSQHYPLQINLVEFSGPGEKKNKHFWFNLYRVLPSLTGSLEFRVKFNAGGSEAVRCKIILYKMMTKLCLRRAIVITRIYYIKFNVEVIAYFITL